MTENNGQFTISFTGRQGQNGTSKYCNDDDDDDDDDDYGVDNEDKCL